VDGDPKDRVRNLELKVEELERRVDALEQGVSKTKPRQQPKRDDLGSPIVESKLQDTMLGIDETESQE
jgi:hypothetical protein